MTKRPDPDTLRKALMDRAGISIDPLVSAKVFSERRQGAQETVKDFEGALKKLFKEAYLKRPFQRLAFCDKDSLRGCAQT